jgi:hypothetical protein
VETGNSDITLPPGSRLVLELLNPLKRAVHRHNNAPRFKFLDLLKPERRTAALLLPYLDWDLARSRSGLFVTLQTQRFLRRFERALRRGKVLGLTAEIAPVGMEEWLADAVAEEFDDAARSAPEATLRRVDRWISGEAPVSAGSLAAHGGAIRGVARWFLQHTSQDRSFFDARALSKDDGWVIERELPEGSGPRVAIAGHTHAARFHDFGDGRVYVNTGTWMDLMALPRMNNEMAIKRWIDRLERGDARRICWRRTYAEVTVDGPALRVWGRGAQAERLLSRWRTRTART